MKDLYLRHHILHSLNQVAFARALMPPQHSFRDLYLEGVEGGVSVSMLLKGGFRSFELLLNDKPITNKWTGYFGENSDDDGADKDNIKIMYRIS